MSCGSSDGPPIGNTGSVGHVERVSAPGWVVRITSVIVSIGILRWDAAESGCSVYSIGSDPWGVENWPKVIVIIVIISLFLLGDRMHQGLFFYSSTTTLTILREVSITDVVTLEGILHEMSTFMKE